MSCQHETAAWGLARWGQQRGVLLRFRVDGAANDDGWISLDGSFIYHHETETL